MGATLSDLVNPEWQLPAARHARVTRAIHKIVSIGVSSLNPYQAAHGARLGTRQHLATNHRVLNKVGEVD